MRLGTVLLLTLLVVITPLLIFFTIQYLYAKMRGRRSWIQEFCEDMQPVGLVYSPPRF